MKSAPKKTAVKGKGKKVATKPAVAKTQVVSKPSLYGTKFVLPTEVVKLEDRGKGVTSMEASMQRMIVLQYSKDDMFKIFRAQEKWSDRNDKWIADRVQKYFMQELHWMLGTHPAAKKGSAYLIPELHSNYQATITRRVNAKKKASKKSA